MKISPEEIKRILIINSAGIGDVILSTPLARALRKNFPDAQIDFLANPVSAKIAEGNPYIHKVIVYRAKTYIPPIEAGKIFFRYGIKKYYDMAVLARPDVNLGVLAWLCGARYRIGFDDTPSRPWLTHRSEGNNDQKHTTQYQLDVLNAIGIFDNDTSLDYKLAKCDIDNISRKFKWNDSKKVVLVCPFSSVSKKDWNEEGTINLIHQLIPMANCYLVGGKKERPALEKIASQVDEVVPVLAGDFSLGEYAALIRKADLLVTVDTGALHIAGAVHTRVIGLFGPTSELQWGPLGANDVVIKSGYICENANTCWKISCSNQCMRAIDVSSIVSAVKKSLSETTNKESAANIR